MSRLRSSSFGAASRRREKPPRASARADVGPLPDPPPQAGEGICRKGRPRLAHGAPALAAMGFTRELYEAGALSVREIARLAGVTERMIYRYAQSGGWRRRRGVAPGEGSPAATRQASKACVAAAKQARAASEAARAEAAARAAAINAKRESEARCRLFDALNEALLELIRWVAEAREQPWDARTEALQYKMMDAIEAQLAALRPLPRPLFNLFPPPLWGRVREGAKSGARTPPPPTPPR